jgi:predicted RNase H-like nuclease
LRVVALDVANGGWIAVCSDDEPSVRAFSSLALAGKHYGDAVYYVDMPIGLTDGPSRIADAEARLYAPPSTVFNAPGLALVSRMEMHPDINHRDACDVHHSTYGQGISQQTYSLIPRIIEARRFRDTAGYTVREYHPEVTAAFLGGHTLSGIHRKKVLLGQLARMKLLVNRLTTEQFRCILTTRSIVDAIDAAMGVAAGLAILAEPDRAVHLGADEDQGMIWAWSPDVSPSAVGLDSQDDVDALIQFLFTGDGA